MSDLDLEAIKARWVGVDTVPGDPASDVPLLVAELERVLRLLGEPFPTSSAYEDAMQALADERAATGQLRSLLAEVLGHFDQKGHPGFDAYEAVRTDWLRVETVERWRSHLGGSGD